MESALIININEATRERIIKSAFNRFRQYGYTKSTMAEIAEDCGMSAANLYRYFKNKQEIACACVEGCIEKRLEIIKQTIHGSELTSASEKLLTLILTTLRICHDIFENDEKIYELIAHVTDEKPEVIHNKISVIQSEIKTILNLGIASGEFKVDNINETTSAIYTSIALFDTPVFMGFYPLETFERLAQEVFNLILKGIGQHA